jgi:ferredoxin hydrogenase large subunit
MALQSILRSASPPPTPDQASTAPFLQVDPIQCHKCAVCEGYCPTGAIASISTRRFDTHQITPTRCINCGQCLTNCAASPPAVFESVSFIDEVKAKLTDPSVITAAMPAPSIRYTLGQVLNNEEGGIWTGRMVALLKQMGFKYVWDVEYGADVTIFEEATELLGRMTGSLNRPLPQLTSCCPGWVKYIETYEPSLIPYLSTTRSPAQILGALAKTYGAQKLSIDPLQLYTVQVMPCVAKKFEGLRPENNRSGFRGIDATLNTRDLLSIVTEMGISWGTLADQTADEPFRVSSGAATIFCASGGVMEAALRYAIEVITKKTFTGDLLMAPGGLTNRNNMQGIISDAVATITADPSRIDFTQSTSFAGVREGTVNADGKILRVAVVNGLRNVAPIIQQIKQGTSPYVAVEVMSCPGGCINGGGQPLLGV